MLKKPDNWKKPAFTLPEVIISFSVLALVITTATNVLSLVIRTNSDNVNNLVAYGLAEEGIEGMRFVRDSNFLLGLDFDGKAKSAINVWGTARIFDVLSGEQKYFKMIDQNDQPSTCDKNYLTNCLPFTLEDLTGDVATLLKSSETLVYRNSSDDGKPRYFQEGLMSAGPDTEKETPYHRVIVVTPIKSVDKFDILRVSSIVSWQSSIGTSEGGSNQRQVVLTTELTDWK